MTYPPRPHQEHDNEKIKDLIRTRAFAHLFSTDNDGHHVTRLPFVLDCKDENREDGAPHQLRAHMNAQNPQAKSIDGADVLVAFSGPDTYVSPNWRTSFARGATWDYTAVHVWGKARRRDEREFFKALINDLAAAAEPQFAGLSDRPDWSYSSVTEDYVDRLLPHLVSFEIEITKVKGISKLHQDFPKEDATLVSNTLAKSDKPQSREISDLIKQRLSDKSA